MISMIFPFYKLKQFLNSSHDVFVVIDVFVRCSKVKFHNTVCLWFCSVIGLLYG